METRRFGGLKVLHIQNAMSHVSYLRVEEDLRPEKLLVADVDLEWLLGDGVDAAVLLDVLVGVGVELVELFGDVGADVAVALLDGLGRLQRLLRRDPDLALAQQALQQLILKRLLRDIQELSFAFGHDPRGHRVKIL